MCLSATATCSYSQMMMKVQIGCSRLHAMMPYFKEIEGYGKVKAKVMGLFKNYSLHNQQYSISIFLWLKLHTRKKLQHFTVK